MIYEPREDSELLLKHIKTFAKGSVLDMGTGSGILAEEAAKFASKIVAVDIDDVVVAFCKKKFPHIECYKSNLFEKVIGKFDCIIFNPPYLPVGNHLKVDGVVLLLFSTFTNKQKVEDLICENGFVFEPVDSKPIPWETLYVYALRKKIEDVEEF